MAGFLIVPVLLFVLAGRSLSNAGGKRGGEIPWVAVSILSSLPLFFFQAFVIPTGAMEDTLLIGDRILVRQSQTSIPGLGDLVVFVYPIDRV